MGISRRRYALHRGVSEMAVRKAIASGRISVQADGSIDPARADAEWAAQTDPAKQRGPHARALGTATAAGTARAGDMKPVPRAAIDAVEETLRDPDHFQQGRDGESAARTYWVPIWALLFSMVGAFTLVFKLIFTVSEYVQRRSFRRANAADSILANTVIANSKSLIAGGLLFVALFVYFSDNRVTSTDNYIRLHKQMWHDQPIVGAIAAHWTINAQALLYPFTRKIRPTWMTFDQDPLYWLPWHVGNQEDE